MYRQHLDTFIARFFLDKIIRTAQHARMRRTTLNKWLQVQLNERKFVSLSFMKICIEQEFSKTLVPWVGKAGKMIAFFIGQRLRENHIDLTTKQWILLKILNGQDGRAQSDLALITDRNKASLVRLIDTMERKKLVRRKRDVLDRRVNRIFLTGHGRKVYETTLPTVREAFEYLQQDIQIENIETVISTIKKVLNNIKHYEVTAESN